MDNEHTIDTPICYLTIPGNTFDSTRVVVNQKDLKLGSNPKKVQKS